MLAVNKREFSYSMEQRSVGIKIPKPPSFPGRENSLRSKSLLTYPLNKAGSNTCRIAFSRGCN